ncbi:MAG TPA: hypothetical protein VGR37_06330 [Longimicrobiaceae bacterium]|nr:hypothetical protein [Longimicrobiaceae bacterium]
MGNLSHGVAGSETEAPALAAAVGVPAHGIDGIFAGDPAAVYGRMDARTRGWYRAIAERWSQESGIPAEEVARRAIARAAAAHARHPAGDPSAHVGYYLAGPGARAFRDDLGFSGPWYGVLERALFSGQVVRWYLGLLSILALAQFGGAVLYAGSSGRELLLGIVAGLIGLPIFYLNARSIVPMLLGRYVPVRELPRMEFSGGIPDEHRALVAVPTILGSVERGRELLERLERLAEENRDPNLRFALVTDFRDADSERLPGDEEILSSLEEGVACLNERHRDGAGDRFFVLHRERRWNAAESAWMGWERKRGKILELIRLIRGRGSETSFRWIFGDLGRACAAGSFRYVITLDDQTRMEPGAAHDLVRTAAHPLNAPRFDPGRGRVVEGYAILQPAVVLVPPGESTPYARHILRLRPLPPVRARRPLSDTQFDLSGVTRYAGKGLYHADVFLEVLDQALPENHVLGHDQIEGYYARTAWVGDVTLSEAVPARFCSGALQRHRWIRGHWQALPWILGRHVRDADGRKRPNPIGIRERYALLRVLRDGTAVLPSFCLLVLGWTVLPGSPAVWTMVALSYFLLPMLLGFARGGGRAIRAAVLRPAHPSTGRNGEAPNRGRPATGVLAVQALRTAFRVTVLAYEAAVALDAIARSSYRMLVSRRWLLEWTAQHEVEAGAAGRTPRHLRGAGISTVIALATIAAVAAVRREAIPVALPFTVLWTAAPWILARLDRVDGPAPGDRIRPAPGGP